MFSQRLRAPSYICAVLLASSPVISAVLCAVGGAIPSPWRHFFYAAAGFILLCGTFVTLKFQFVEYIYEISEGERPGTYDLIVTSVLGKKITTECRIALSGSVTPVKKRMKTADKTKRYRLCQLFPGADKYIFTPFEAEGEYSILLCPNEEMLNVMKMLGVKIE